MDIARRNVLAAGAGSLLAAGAAALPAMADEGNNGGDTMYGHGLVWNRDLPGVLGELKLSFDLRVNLETGIGFGTALDPIHPGSSIHYSIGSVERIKRPKGESRFVLRGVVTKVLDDPNCAICGFSAVPGETPVILIAETVGDTTAVAIRIGEYAFAGAGLVVIAIIAVLIGLLLPAVQK